MTTIDPHAEYAAAHKGLHSRAPVPEGVVVAIEKFAKLAKDGMPISFVALQRFVAEHHNGYQLGRMKAETICKSKGLAIWWSPGK